MSGTLSQWLRRYALSFVLNPTTLIAEADQLPYYRLHWLGQSVLLRRGMGLLRVCFGNRIFSAARGCLITGVRGSDAPVSSCISGY